MGELTWHYQLDNDCNQFGDFGWHLYEITRAYRPVRPHAVLPILFQRCDPYANPVPCTSSNIL
jgi:hypothetical protein